MFEIIVGTYEQYLLGYKVQDTENEYQMKKSFITHSHMGSIRAVATHKYYLASASADETICVYDLRYRRETGKLMHHQGTVNYLAFTSEGSHLFTCSSDGSISAVHCGNWQIEKHWLKAHKGCTVHSLAIHHSGKLALSTGEDGVLRTWNLIKGRPAYATNLVPKLKLDAKWITIVKWSPDGDKYLLAVNRNIYVYSVETASIEKEFTFNSKVICVEFLSNTLIAIGHENGEITFYNLELVDPHVINIKAHDMRVKCIAHMSDLLVSASSSGEIKLWRYNISSMKLLQTVNCGARITCLSLASIFKQEKYEENLVEVKDEEKDLTEEEEESDLTLKEVVEVIDEGENLTEKKKTDEKKNFKVKSKNNKKVKTLQISDKEKDSVEQIVEVTDENESLTEEKDKQENFKTKSKKNKKVKTSQIPSKNHQNRDVKKRKLMKEEIVQISKKKKKKTID